MSNIMKDITENIKVFLRQRPFLSSNTNIPSDDKQQDSTKCSTSQASGIREISNNIICSYYSSVNKTYSEFKMDYIFDPSSNQDELYNTIARPIVDSALLGYSGTIFAYGPTSSGKTYTMRGDGDDTNKKGIMPRCVEHLLANVKDSTCIQASYLQIYCENITDLLSPQSSTLSIREKGANNIYVDGLSKYKIESLDDLWSLLSRGDENRNTAETNMNEFSSRSHAVLMINILIKESDNDVDNKKTAVTESTYRESNLVLVDLAGSERASASEGKDFMRLEEAKSINLSLSALGNCMSAMAEGRSHIPFRDSKLTRLLQGCLGGSSRTAVIVNLPPGEDSTGEILNALRFASRASKVKVVAKISKIKDYESLYLAAKRALDQVEKNSSSNVESVFNNKIEQKDNIITKQAAEIEALKAKVTAYENSSPQSLLVKSDSKSTSDISELDKEFENKLKIATDRHCKSIEEVNRSFQMKLSQYKNNSDKLNKEMEELRDDLNTERERHLNTVKEFRAIQDKKKSSESLLKSRIEELLLELSEKRSIIDDQESNINNSNKKILSLESDILDYRMKMNDMVSKEQVKEMEKLFLDTVTKLSNRVNVLEKTGQQQPLPKAQPPNPSSNRDNNRFVNKNNYDGIASGRISSAGESSLNNNNNSRNRIEPGGRVRSNVSQSNYDNILHHSNSSTKVEENKLDSDNFFAKYK